MGAAVEVGEAVADPGTSALALRERVTATSAFCPSAASAGALDETADTPAGEVEHAARTATPRSAVATARSVCR